MIGLAPGRCLAIMGKDGLGQEEEAIATHSLA